MSRWKLPRKRKKAFIAKYGRGVYHALRRMSGKHFEGVVDVTGPSDRLVIGFDSVGGPAGSVAVIGRLTGKQHMEVLTTVRMPSTPPSRDYYSSTLTPNRWRELNKLLTAFYRERNAFQFRLT